VIFVHSGEFRKLAANVCRAVADEFASRDAHRLRELANRLSGLAFEQVRADPMADRHSPTNTKSSVGPDGGGGA
jgi:hypothetical protein